MVSTNDFPIDVKWHLSDHFSSVWNNKTNKKEKKKKLVPILPGKYSPSLLALRIPFSSKRNWTRQEEPARETQLQQAARSWSFFVPTGPRISFSTQRHQSRQE